MIILEMPGRFAEMSENENFFIVLDQSHKVVYFNQYARQVYPHISTGSACPAETPFKSDQCKNCILNSKRGGSETRFIMSVKKWFNLSTAQIEWPDHGLCWTITGSKYPNLTKELMSRIRFMIPYNFIIEMNLTLDRYVLTSEMNYGEETKLEEESLTSLLKRTASSIVHPDDHKKFWNLVNPKTMEERLSKAGEPLSAVIRERSSKGTWDEVTVTLIPEENNGNGDSLVMAFFTIKEVENVPLNRRDREKDKLTGLLTLSSFIEEYEIFRRDFHQSICLISMDIYHFRFFNKWYSRWQGDRLLKSISMFLQEMDRTFDSVSCYDGGDNFYIIMEYNETVINYLTLNLNKLISTFDGIEGFSMLYGGYILPSLDSELMDAVDLATMATSRADGSSGTVVWYNNSISKEIETELQIIPEIEKALEDDEFTFYLQPKCTISNNSIIGSEALVRWNHKIRGIVPPGEFIPVLEKTGIITKVDCCIWEKVCKTIRKWLDMGLKPLPISVNVSRIDIYNLNVPEIFSTLIKKYNISPDLLEIEITESAFTKDQEIIGETSGSLRKLGFKILIDDFGSGYSSLNMLKDIPADILKMDIKFFDLNKANFEKGFSIISSVVELSHNINLPVIAEGVETADQITVLKAVGLDYVQGFYYYRPIPISDFEKLLVSMVKNK